MTVIVNWVEAVRFPIVASMVAVKFCGAAAGVATTMSWVIVVGGRNCVHCGRKVSVNPELGKPCSSKQADPGMFKLVRVRLIVALSPTLITAAEGLADNVSSGSEARGRVVAPSAGGVRKQQDYVHAQQRDTQKEVHRHGSTSNKKFFDY